MNDKPSSDRAPEGATFAEPKRVHGKHRFMAGTCVDCGKPLDPVCSANLNIPTVAPEGAKERVLAIFPNASAWRNGTWRDGESFWKIYHNKIGLSTDRVLGHGSEESEAWADADSRLIVRISPESAPTVNYVSRSSPDHTAICKVCGAIALPGGKCASCGGTDLVVEPDDGPLTPNQQRANLLLVKRDLEALSTADKPDRFHACRALASLAPVLDALSQPSPQRSIATPEESATK